MRPAITVLFLWAVAGVAQAAPAQNRPPNIIHIIADDVGYDDVGAFGAKDIATPNIDRLAAEGMKLTSFYAPHPTCTPSRAAMLTGSYALRVGLPGVLFPDAKIGLNPSEITVAELLKTRGYSTALIGKWHLGHQRAFLPHKHGFDVFFGIPYPNDHGPERLRGGKSLGFPNIPLYRNDDVVEVPTQLGALPERLVSEAVGFIDKNKDKPFFLHFANVETHTPWFVPRRCQNKSPAGVYGDAVTCLDWAVGEIVATLKRLQLDQTTLIVFTSDNGPLVDTYRELEGIYGHAATVDSTRKHLLKGGKYQGTYEGGTRVSAIVRWPGKVKPGTTSDALVAGFDLYPTFAHAAGAAVPRDRIIDGKDLAPILTGKSTASPHEAFFYYETTNLRGVRQGKWKLAFAGNTKFANGVESFTEDRLFDLSADIGETTDVAKQHPDIVKRLRALGDKMRADLGDKIRGSTGKNRRPPGEAVGS